MQFINIWWPNSPIKSTLPITRCSPAIYCVGSLDSLPRRGCMYYVCIYYVTNWLGSLIWLERPSLRLATYRWNRHKHVTSMKYCTSFPWRITFFKTKRHMWCQGVYDTPMAAFMFCWTIGTSTVKFLVLQFTPAKLHHYRLITDWITRYHGSLYHSM